jgi:hypothetical protein
MIDFDKLRDQWRRAFSPISSRQLETWSKDLKDELRTIPYLRIVKVTEGGFMNMLEYKLVLNVDGLNTSMVRADLERVWASGVASGLKTGYTFRETESGLKFYFAALNNVNNYVTGLISIAKKDGA